jgi:hypothetical protein
MDVLFAERILGNYVIDEWEVFPIWIIKKRTWLWMMKCYDTNLGFSSFELNSNAIDCNVQWESSIFFFLSDVVKIWNMIAKNLEALTFRSVNYNDINTFIYIVYSRKAETYDSGVGASTSLRSEIREFQLWPCFENAKQSLGISHAIFSSQKTG